MRGISVFVGVALAMPIVGSSAHAASMVQEWKWCKSDDSEVSVAACSIIIKSGHKTQSDKSLAEAYTDRGNGYSDKGEPHDAIEDYTQAIKLDPTRADAFAGRGIQYYELDDYKRAMPDLDQAIRLNPGAALNWAWRSRVKAQLNDAEGANADMAHAHELDPDVEEEMPDED